MKRYFSFFLFSFWICISNLSDARAAVGCTLEHPNQDIKRVFPTATTYRMRDLFVSRHSHDKKLLEKMAAKLRTHLDPEFETLETPYSFYAVYKGEEYIGLVIGNNIRFEDGLTQIFVAYEPKGKIKDVYIQKISSSDGASFRSKYYREQYTKFRIDDTFEEADIRPPLRLPSKKNLFDHSQFIRGVRFNMLLVKLLYNPFKE